MNNIKQYSNSFILEFRRIFLLADLYIDCWDAGRNPLHSDLGKAYLGDKKGVGGHSINRFWKVAISDALDQRQSAHKIARLINHDFKCITPEPEEFEAFLKVHVHDIRDRQPAGKGTLDPQVFRRKLYEHYVRYLQDCIDYQDGEGFRDWSRLAEYIFHPNPVVGKTIMSSEANAPTHREHVVPLRCINNLVIEGLKKGTNSKEIHVFLDGALKIVILHKKEQMDIDQGRGWKDCMPQDWKIGDSVYARLEKANIKFTLGTPAP